MNEKHARRAEAAWNPENPPWRYRPDRGRTPHEEAVRLMNLGWRWNGWKYECRKDWETAVLGYH